MKVTEEIKDALPRQSEIVEYEREAQTNLEQCLRRLTGWFRSYETVIVGHGGNHVFVSLKDTGKRVLLITE